MPTGIARSQYIPEIAKALGKNPQSIRERLNKAGYLAPYLDLPRILKILESQGLNLAKYRARKAVASYRANGANDDKAADADANGHDESQPALVVPTPPSAAPPVTQTLPVVATEPDARSQKIARLRAAWDRKLVPRLARLLPQGDTAYGKKRVKQILKNGNYPGPGWDDEVRAIEVFRAAGIDVSRFEWQNPTKAIRLSEAGENTVWKLGQAEKSRTMLEQFENAWFDEVFKGNLPRRVFHPLTYAFDALNELRAKKPKGNRD